MEEGRVNAECERRKLDMEEGKGKRCRAQGKRHGADRLCLIELIRLIY